MYKTPFIPVRVLYWTSKTDYKEYIFDHSDDSGSNNIIKQTLYKDDTVETALNKIAAYFGKKEKFYAWSGNTSILFNVKQIFWKGYKVNPFNSTDTNSNELNEPILYNYTNKDLFSYTTVNIVFINDLSPTLQKNKYYFSDLKFQSMRHYIRNNEKLSLLRDVDISNIKIMEQYYSRIGYYDKITPNFLLGEMFDNMYASNYIDMIQWVDDQTKILYKLSEQHKIRQEYFVSWTNVEKIEKIKVINIYSIVGKLSYCKVSIDQDGNIYFNYVINNKEFLRLQDIDIHKKELLNQIQSYHHGKLKIKLKEISLNSKILIDTNNSSFKDIVKGIGENIDIFHVVENKIDTSNQFLTVVYKRSSNYNTNSTVYDYIKSQINAGISKIEIMEMLSSLGITGNLSEMINDEFNMMNNENEIEDRQIKIQNNGTIVTIYPHTRGYEISIVNSANIKETSFLIFWLSRIIAKTISKSNVKPKSKSPIAAISTKSSKSSQNSISSVSSQDSITEFDFSGGAKQKTNYLLDRLQKADKNLFSDNYARFKCQSQEQPIVISEQEKEYIERTNQAHYDNILGYSSDSKTTNYYTCPRLWCPKSNVPLSVDDPNAKCPENEEPMQFFWGNDKNKKRYVKLIKPKDGLSFPCCKKRDPGIKNSNKTQSEVLAKVVTDEVVVDNKDNENYIINHVAPIDKNRFGTIPEYLHKLMFKDKNISYENCSKVLHKTNACIVRQGIQSKKTDSLVVALSKILNFNSKKDFVKDIGKKLDLLKYISLNNGFVCKSFMNIREVVPENNVSLQKQFRNFQKTKLFNLNTSKVNLSRSLNIFKSYQTFLKYISGNETTSSIDHVYFYELIRYLYGINLVVWEKDIKTDELFFNCPNQTLIYGDFNPKIVMVIKEGGYYEPLVLKMRNTTSESFFNLNDYPQLKSIFTKCYSSSDISNDITFKNIYVLHNWILDNNMFKQNEIFILHKVFINDDLTIDKIMTKGGILLTFPKIGISFLPELLELNIDSKNVYFYSDVVDTVVNITVLKKDLSIFLKKCDSLDFKIFIGSESNTNQESVEKYQTQLVLKMNDYNNNMIIHTNKKNDFYSSLEQVETNSKRWFELQITVARTILKHYDEEKLKNLNKKSREERVSELKKLFQNIPEKSTVQIILEEIPLFSHKSISQWLSNIIIYTKYNNDDVIMRRKNNKIFSQYALVKNGTFNIPRELIGNFTISPNISENTMNTDMFDINENTNIQTFAPTIFIGTRKKLPTKWILQKKSIWSKLVYIQGEYTKNTIPLFVKWLTKVIGLEKVTYDDILNKVFSIYYNNVDNEELMLEFLSDSSYKNQWLSKIGKTIDSNKILMNTINTFSREKKISIIDKIMNDGKLYPTKITLSVISDLLNVSILLVNRGDYGKFDKTKSRNDLQNLKVSSNFFQARIKMEQRPLFIFYVDTDKEKTLFYLVVDNNKKDLQFVDQIYMTYKEVPDNIKVLIEEHMR